MPTVRLLHLSDLHLAGFYRAFYESLGNIFPLTVYNPDTLLALSEIIYIWREDLDAILISGDIAVAGDDDNLLNAIRKLSASIKQAEFNKPIILVPGNHDRYRNFWSGTPAGRNFDRHFSSSWPVGIQGIYSCFLPNKVSPILAIICADFSLKQIRDSSCIGGHWGQGKVYKDKLQSLKDETEGIAKSYPDCGIIWMLHFAPKFENVHHGFDPRMFLLDVDDLIEAAKNGGVKYIFCGHTHQYADYVIAVNSGVQIHCAGTSTCLGNDQDTTIHLRLIELDGPNVVQVKSLTYLYDPDRRIFSDSL